MLRSSLCNYNNAYIPFRRTLTFANIAAKDAVVNNVNKKVIFKSCAPFYNCISRKNYKQVEYG